MIYWKVKPKKQILKKSKTSLYEVIEDKVLKEPIKICYKNIPIGLQISSVKLKFKEEK